MMQIAYGAQARAKVLSGADRLADAVRVTLGPKGRNGAVHQKKNTQGASFADRAEPGAPALITNDGATIAESIVLPDPMEDLGYSCCVRSPIRPRRRRGTAHPLPLCWPRLCCMKPSAAQLRGQILWHCGAAWKRRGKLPGKPWRRCPSL